MNILIIGGSNSVMNPGYATQLAAALKDEHGVEIARIDNISVGANNSIIGIEAWLLHRGARDYDVVVIEFVINDYKMAEKDRIDTWRAGYEGLVRLLVGAMPDAHVINLVLGQNNPSTEKRLARLKTEIAALSAHYQGKRHVYNLDFDGFLRRRTKNDAKQIGKHYLDSAHYARPRTTGLAASYLARCIARPRQSLPTDAALPESLHRPCFDGAGMIHIPDLVPAEAKEFRNARFQRTALSLPAGRTLSFTAPGPLIAISFLATRDAGMMRVEEEGEEPVAFFTCHAHALKAPGRFVIKNHVLGIRTWSDRGPRRVTIASLADSSPTDVAATFHQGFNMLASPEPQRAVYLCNALYHTNSV